MTTYPWKALVNPDSPHLICIICASIVSLLITHIVLCHPCCTPSTYPHHLVVIVPWVLVLVAIVIVASFICHLGLPSCCPHVVVDLPVHCWSAPLCQITACICPPYQLLAVVGGRCCGIISSPLPLSYTCDPRAVAHRCGVGAVSLIMDTVGCCCCCCPTCVPPTSSCSWGWGQVVHHLEPFWARAVIIFNSWYL